MKRHVESFWRRQLWLRRVCYGLLLLAAAAMIALMSFHPPDQVAAPSHSLPTDMIPGMLWQQNGTPPSGEFRILDVISFGTEVLVLIRVSEGFQFPSKERLQCRCGSSTQPALALHFVEPLVAAVVCNAPPSEPWNQTSISINRETRTSMTMTMPWNSTRMVYEAYSTQHDVALFVHGFNQTLGYGLSRFQCVYGDRTATSSVTAQAYEIFRCGRPPKLKTQKVSLRFDGQILPSVAYYKPPPPARPLARRHHICACTMIYNGAKFLREWVYYHSHLGVEKFIIYDNNSDDNLDEEISNLARFNVTKRPWPWVKTQEAALSHCALAAEPECKWMLFNDIDEYIFPSERFLESKNVSILAGFINEVVTKDENVGQIATYCRNFGPSGLSVSPRAGVTQGYTCRLQRQRRHKSIVLLSAIADSLANQVHHFTLKPPYVMAQIRPWVAIINHYKFQVWDEFKTKFHRRAATYVADWTEDRNHGSNDRVSGLGTKPVKPADWESRYCEVQDYGLRDYTRRIFGTSQGDGRELHLAWE